MASRINPSSFDKALGEFKEGLGRREIEEFRTTTLKELKISIGKLQAQQHAQGQQQDLNRLQPFIEAIEQYGKMVGIFYSNDDIVTFVWVSDSLVFSITLQHKSSLRYRDLSSSCCRYNVPIPRTVLITDNYE